MCRYRTLLYPVLEYYGSRVTLYQLCMDGGISNLDALKVILQRWKEAVVLEGSDRIEHAYYNPTLLHHST